MVKVTHGAKWNFGFAVVGTHAAGGVHGAGTKTEVDLVDGLANVLFAIELILVETKLCLGVILKFIKCNANDADGRG